MTSSLKFAANRANARKSRGPQTSAGKQRSSRNALRHGLSACHHSPLTDAEITKMAKAICGDDTDPLLFDQAVVIAECELLLRKVRLQKIAAIERLRDPWLHPIFRGDRRIAMATLRMKKHEIAYAEFCWLGTKLRKQGEEVLTLLFTPEEVDLDKPVVRYKPAIERDEHEAIRVAVPDLNKLIRYERRALSRRKNALYKFIAIKLIRKSGSIQPH